MRRSPLKRTIPLGRWKETRGSKYGNRKTTVNGVVLDSGLEGDRYRELLILQKAGEITDLQVHVTYRLDLQSPHLKTGSIHLCKYIADFVYNDRRGVVVVEDTKSFITMTDLFTLKKRLMKAIHGIDVQVLTRKDVGRMA